MEFVGLLNCTITLTFNHSAFHICYEPWEVFFLCVVLFSNRPVMKYYHTAVSMSERRIMISYLWGILGRAQGPTAPLGTEPLLALMPPPCHQGAAARCLGQSSSAWCYKKQEHGGAFRARSTQPTNIGKRRQTRSKDVSRMDKKKQAGQRWWWWKGVPGGERGHDWQLMLQLF